MRININTVESHISTNIHNGGQSDEKNLRKPKLTVGLPVPFLFALILSSIQSTLSFPSASASASASVSAFTPNASPSHHNYHHLKNGQSKSKSQLFQSESSVTCKRNLNRNLNMNLNRNLNRNTVIGSESKNIINAIRRSDLQQPKPTHHDNFYRLDTTRKRTITSFLPISNYGHQSMLLPTSTRLLTLQSQRYGGKTNESVGIHKNNIIDINTMNTGGGRGTRILGFDLKMVASSHSSQSSSSMEECTAAAAATTTRPTTTTTDTTSETYHNSISPIKKQVMKNVLFKHKKQFNPTCSIDTFMNETNNHYDRIISSSSSLTSSTNNQRNTKMRQTKHTNNTNYRTSSTTTHHSSSTTTNSNHVPMWLPFIPTTKQIESLKLLELRGACVERGLIKVRNHNVEM
jgi:hypothetical protein